MTPGTPDFPSDTTWGYARRVVSGATLDQLRHRPFGDTTTWAQLSEPAPFASRGGPSVAQHAHRSDQLPDGHCYPNVDETLPHR